MSAESSIIATSAPRPLVGVAADQPVVVAPSVRVNPSRGVRPRVAGKFLEVNGERFWAAAVTYGSFAANEQGEPFPPFRQLRDDFARMHDAGVNTVRLYSPPSDRIADTAADAGLYLLPDICWGPRSCELDRAEDVKFIRDWTRGHARRLADHPAILMYSIGNEVPPLIVRWYGRERIETFLREQGQICKEEAPQTLVTYCNHPPTEYLHLPFLDVVSYNLYLERESDYRRYLARLQMLAGDRPLFLSEIGLDSRAHGDVAQARSLQWQLKAAIEKGACGTAVYAWTDEWSIHEHAIEGWAFGLTDAQRRPRLALDAVEEIYRGDRYELRQEPWPRVSVVVASYNGAATLDECLSSLEKLDYPEYEVILIDDGSKDHTKDVAARHRHVRCIHVDNGGLSKARNLGIEAATGSIVAFIDSDAYADPDWLYFLVTAMEEQGAAGVGGPNLTPPADGFTAQCVSFAPGNPTHVLIDNELAEHVPGCNMAFRKRLLESIGLFDPTHRAAGDDVDVCWKLLVREKKIAFSPCAVVWHHRRATAGAYLRQQRGYGYAESHLQQRYPSRFNIFGGLVWNGGIYDDPHAALRAFGLPAIFRPRIYQGRHGAAQFQSIYQPFRTWWFQVFTTAEWQALSWCVLLAGLAAMFSSGAAALALLALAGAMVTATIASAAVPALHAWQSGRWTGLKRARAALLVGALHLLQPLARAWGRLRGWRPARRLHAQPDHDVRVWGNVSQRHTWLESLHEHLLERGWVARHGDEWEDVDLEVLGPGPYRVQLVSTCEEMLEQGRHYVRFRVAAQAKRIVPLAWALLLLTLPVFVLMPYLLPLALPVLFVAARLAGARREMSAAVASLALEIADARQMPRVQEYA